MVTVKQILILAGEWMPVTFLKNINGKFKNVLQHQQVLKMQTGGGTQLWQVISGTQEKQIILLEMLA